MQIHMLHDDTSRIQLELVPMIEEIISEWVIIHFFAATPSQQATIEDFSFQLSSLHIGRCVLLFLDGFVSNIQFFSMSEVMLTI